MKIYSKLRAKIRKNTTRIKKVVGVISVGYAMRYGKINSIPESLSSNSTQQFEKLEAERLGSCVEENIELVNSSGRVIKTGSGILISNKNISEGSNAGRFTKTGAGARAKADSRRAAKSGKFSSGSAIIPGSDALTSKTIYHRHHQNAPLSCKTQVKLQNSPFGNNDNNQPPSSQDGNFDESNYKGGSSPFIDKFDYNNPSHTPENTDFSNKSRMSHSYDGHAEDCFGMTQNRNKESLQKFQTNIRDYIESPETERINGSYRYEVPAYHYKKPNEDLVVTVNATDNRYISSRNATEFQLEKLATDGNLGYDTRPNMTLTLKLRGPKG